MGGAPIKKQAWERTSVKLIPVFQWRRTRLITRSTQGQGVCILGNLPRPASCEPLSLRLLFLFPGRHGNIGSDWLPRTRGHEAQVIGHKVNLLPSGISLLVAWSWHLVLRIVYQRCFLELGSQSVDQVQPAACFLKVKFYWNTATPIGLRIACGFFSSTKAKLNSFNRCTESKIFTTQPVTEKVGQFLV